MGETSAVGVSNTHRGGDNRQIGRQTDRQTDEQTGCRLKCSGIMWLSATVTVKRPKKYATKLWTKLATNFKLVRWEKTNRKRRREKYECKKSCSRPHTHKHTATYKHTQTHTYANGFTAPLCCCCFSFVFPPPIFFFVFWIRYCVLVLLWNHAV